MNRNIELPNGIASQIKCSRTFKCWLVELRAKARKMNADLPDLDFTRAKQFYLGGYSPKMVIAEELRLHPDFEI